jgi:hypothetical protein
MNHAVSGRARTLAARREINRDFQNSPQGSRHGSTLANPARADDWQGEAGWVSP